MLSRVAERVYWLARYLERVENTARLINVHTALLMDLPEHMEVNWFTLVTIFDAEQIYYRKHPRENEYDIMHFLLADPSYGGSLINNLAAVRENARTSLDVLPEEVWEQVNELHLLVKSELSSIGNRRRRQKLLLTIMESCQCIWGMIANHMSRNFAYDFLQAGKHLERADMTSRILELSALLMSDNRSETLKQHEGILWATLLRVLNAQQMYIQAHNSSLKGENVLAFLIQNTAFPRSLSFSVKSVGNYLEYLPGDKHMLAQQAEILNDLKAYSPERNPPETIRLMMDELQIALNRLNTSITTNWFYPDYSVS
ncbi:alpha-E domain-containing protein [Methylophaga sp.]|uniref:alpha-E domain-containing protein n=1 Tax=Methylophaga sp. TaxID=2024840 RepID=UPI003A8EE60E